jgi:iron(III) transport system permease protein
MSVERDIMAVATRKSGIASVLAFRPTTGHFIMAVVLLGLGFYLIWPMLLLLINSFNVSEAYFSRFELGLDNWREAFRVPGVPISLWNSIMIWLLVVGISFPVAVLISWTLARTNIPWSNTLEFLFWFSFMMPGIATTIAWIMALDPFLGFLNKAVQLLPFIEDGEGPFNIFSLPGIVWAHIMANGISIKVMLMTPAFRNMDAAMEEAARVSGASNLRTMFRVTLPLMISPMALVFALQLLRIFQSFEIEYLLGQPFDFFVYSTKIYGLVRAEGVRLPEYGQATVLASMTLLVIALIIPLQRWILQRRRYTTVTGSFKPGLIGLGRWKYPAFGTILGLLLLLTIFPIIMLVMGSFMTSAGYFNLNTVWTLNHWTLVLNDALFLGALKTTLILATTAAIMSPLLFSMIAYILVRTRLPGRLPLDMIIWGSGAIPGILSSLGLLQLFLGTPGLTFLYGTLYALLLVVIIQGNTTGTNVLKGVFVQVGADMEEAARISGAGWLRTYFRIWIPLLMPTLILLGTLNFVIAAGTTSSIILLADRGTMTLSLLALEYASPGIGLREEATIVALFIMALTVGLAVAARAFGLRLGVRHDMRSRGQAEGAPAVAGTAPAAQGVAPGGH